MRLGRIPISRDMLRILLDLPPWVKIEGAATLTTDAAKGTISLIVSGPFIGSAKGEPPGQMHLGLSRLVESEPLTRMEPVYSTVECGKTELRELRGADT